jgi:hypothetical protein
MLLSHSTNVAGISLKINDFILRRKFPFLQVIILEVHAYFSKKRMEIAPSTTNCFSCCHSLCFCFQMMNKHVRIVSVLIFRVAKLGKWTSFSKPLKTVKIPFLLS